MPTARPLAQALPTASPRFVATDIPRITPLPTATTLPSPTATATPLTVTLLPTFTATPGALVAHIGESAGGQALQVYRFDRGPQEILLVGGVHGGWEANTVELMQALISYFETHPADVLPGISLAIIPVMNPDGLLIGEGVEGRFNANGVDLNRNWACGWQPDAVFRSQPVDAGGAPFSEPETLAVSAYIEAAKPVAALFYHSAADGVFAGDCPARQGEWQSGRLAAVYGEAARYSYGRSFSAYPVSGTAPSWVDGLGIAAADVELASATETQFQRNLRGVMAVQCWVLGPSAVALAACTA